jgi:hypothetical protein
MAKKLNMQPDDLGWKPVGSVGRPDATARNGNPLFASNEATVQQSSRQGTVVIRATVEHIGLAGDTEMTVTVRWPAATFCVAPCTQPAAPNPPPAGATVVPQNGPLGKNLEPPMLFGSLDQDPAPAGGAAAAQSKDNITIETAAPQISPLAAPKNRAGAPGSRKASK